MRNTILNFLGLLALFAPVLGFAADKGHTTGKHKKAAPIVDAGSVPLCERDGPKHGSSTKESEEMLQQHIDEFVDQSFHLWESWTDNHRAAPNDDIQAPISLPSTMIIQFVSSSYSNVTLNWLAILENMPENSISRSDVFLVCTDSQIKEFLRERDIWCETYTEPKGIKQSYLGGLWVARSFMIRRLLERGISVIASDSDALWMSNPMDDFKPLQDFDILASQGTFPSELHSQWGVTACMGFIYFRSSPLINEVFMPQFMEQVVIHSDDQIAVNCALYRLGLRISSAPVKIEGDVYTAAECRKTKKISAMRKNDGTQGASSLLKVAFLSPSRYVRDCSDVRSKVVKLSDVSVLHCLVHKTGHDKERWMKDIGVWVIDVTGEYVRGVSSSDWW